PRAAANCVTRSRCTSTDFASVALSPSSFDFLRYAAAAIIVASFQGLRHSLSRGSRSAPERQGEACRDLKPNKQGMKKTSTAGACSRCKPHYEIDLVTLDSGARPNVPRVAIGTTHNVISP